MLASDAEECIGIDLASGAFVRIVNIGSHAASRPGTYRVAEVTIGRSGDPFDPTRPELVVASGATKIIGEVTGRRVRHLFAELEARDHPGATIVSSRGPSIAYVDLDGSAPSLSLIPAKTLALEVTATGGATMLGITFGGVRQRLPVLDQRLVQAALRAAPRPLTGINLARELGYEPSHVLVGLDDVRDGHVRKVVFALLARARK
ncbi:MAG TPA: hypothetical protein VIJ34_08875 [Acidimicrobiales bacterium]